VLPLSLSLCFGELWRVDQLPRTLSGWFILVDDQSPDGSTGALCSQRARAALFACPDVVEGAVPINAPSVIEYLAGGTEIAIVFGLVSETLGTEERTPLSVDAVAGAHEGVMFRSASHCKNSPFPYVVSAATDSGFRPRHRAKRVSISCAANVS